MRIALYKSTKLKTLGYAFSVLSLIFTLLYSAYIADKRLDWIVAFALFSITILIAFMANRLGQPHPFYIIDDIGIKRRHLWRSGASYQSIAWRDIKLIIKQTVQAEHTYQVASIRLVSGKKLDMPLDFLQRDISKTKISISENEAFTYFEKAFKQYRSM